MTNKDWSTVFEDAPLAFQARVKNTVNRMEREHAAQKPRARTAFVLAAALVALTGAALALNGLGVLDTISDSLKQFLQPEASRLVQTDIAQNAVQPRYARFTVEQAISDGHQVFLSVRVHGDEDVLLMDMESAPADSVDAWRGEYEGTTFADKAAESNRRLVQASIEAVDDHGELLVTSVPEIAYDGEDILYNVTYPLIGEGASLRLCTFDVYGEGETISTGSLTFTIKTTETRAFYTVELPAKTSGGRLTLTGLTVEQTPVATYVTYEYGATDPGDLATKLILRDGVFPDWLNENGEMLQEGTGSNQLILREDGSVRYSAIYRAFAVLPETMTIRFNHISNETPLTIPLVRADTKEETK